MKRIAFGKTKNLCGNEIELDVGAPTTEEGYPKDDLSGWWYKFVNFARNLCSDELEPAVRSARTVTKGVPKVDSSGPWYNSVNFWR